MIFLLLIIWSSLIIIYLLEPILLTEEGEYNFNVIKEIKVTQSYLGLDAEARSPRGCQDEKSVPDCMTEQYLEDLLQECHCLPFNNIISDKQYKIVLSCNNIVIIFYMTNMHFRDKFAK